jgi:anti-sigma regulatory factor (Ser/Thr protein kinase)
MGPDRPVIERFRSHPSVLYHIRQFIRQRASDAALDEETTNDLLLAVSEACANSMLHTATATIRVAWSRRNGCVQVEVADDGVFRRQAPMVDAPGGHGIPLMTALVDELTIREGTRRRPGTLVRLVKCPEP